MVTPFWAGFLGGVRASCIGVLIAFGACVAWLAWADSRYN